MVSLEKDGVFLLLSAAWMEMHISIKYSKIAGSLFYNYKQIYSAVLQGVADSESKFILTNVGAYGKQSDGGTFPGSIL